MQYKLFFRQWQLEDDAGTKFAENNACSCTDQRAEDSEKDPFVVGSAHVER